jgi:hypothetical protein
MVEMLISTAVFSVILLLCATAIIQVGRIFYKGVTINRTQETARRVMEDISQAVQFGANTGDRSFDERVSNDYGGLTVHALCLGTIRYNYSTTTSLGTGSGQSRHVLWKDRIGATESCSTVDLRNPQPSPDGIELLGSNMRVPVFSAVLSGSDMWALNVAVAYGDTADLFTDTNYNKCVSTTSGGQFCAVSTLSTNVAKRL